MGEKHGSRNRAEFDQAHGSGHVSEEFTPLDDEKKVYLTAILLSPSARVSIVRSAPPNGSD